MEVHEDIMEVQEETLFQTYFLMYQRIFWSFPKF